MSDQTKRFLFRFKLEGVHYHIAIYCGLRGSRVRSGQMVLREDEFHALRAALGANADFEKYEVRT